MRPGFGVALLFAAALPLHAFADVESVTVTEGTSLSATFTLDPSTATTADGIFYTFVDPNATVNGMMNDELTINVSQGLGSVGMPPTDSLNLSDANATINQFLTVDGNPTLFFDPGPPPVVNAGTFTASDFSNCLAMGGRAPMQGLPATLALFQAPTNCAVDALVVATTVTPEPSSIALFGTGFLGIAGIVRRRFYA